MPIDYTKRPQSQPSAPTPPPAQAGGAQPVSLSKVTLTKASPSVSLSKQTGVLRVNLSWNSLPTASTGGFLKRIVSTKSGAVDLDLGCLYEFSDGEKGVVQALGNAFHAYGTFTQEPVISLDGDDRSGGRVGGENLSIKLAYAQYIRRVLIFAMIYEGVRSWATADGVITLHPQTGAPIEVRLDEHDPRSPLCAVAMIENVNGELQVRREVRYVQGSQRKLDEMYGWGMRWAAGRK